MGPILRYIGQRNQILARIHDTAAKSRKRQYREIKFTRGDRGKLMGTAAEMDHVHGVAFTLMPGQRFLFEDQRRLMDRNDRITDP